MVRSHLHVRRETTKRCQPREIPLNKKTRAMLAGFMKAKRRRRESLDPTAPMFVSRRGCRMGQRTYQDMIKKWLERAGVATGSFHSLRHTYASLLIANGEHPKYIQVQMGHSSIKVTLDTYGHLMRATNPDAAQKLEDLVLSGSKTVA